MSSVKIVLSDVDGTFLNSNHEVSESTLEAARWLEGKGIPLIFATGRSYASVKAAVSSAGFRPTAGVYSQGLVVLGHGGEEEIIHEAILDKGIVRECLELARTHPLEKDFTVIGYCKSLMLAVKEDHLEILTRYGEMYPRILPFTADAYEDFDINKLLICTRPGAGETRDILRRDLMEKLQSRVDFTCAVAHQLEVLPPGNNKGTGCLKLLEYLRIDKQNAMALGDAENDLEMLQLVGKPIAMGNAAPVIKKVAGVELAETNNNGGWAKSIYKVFPRAVSDPLESKSIVKPIHTAEEGVMGA